MMGDRIWRGAHERRYSAALFGAACLLSAAAATAWTAVPVADDPLVRMPGTQPANGVSLEAPGRCLNCHAGYDLAVEPGHHWAGSMMAQAARDPLFWASVTVAVQDSIWLLGTPNAGDLCLRCHSPGGWLGGNSDPPNGSALSAADFDGVHCDACHRAYDPLFEATFAGDREGSDWAGYWDESGASTTPSAAEAATTRALDQTEALDILLFNGNPFYDTVSYYPLAVGWVENGGGQYFVSASNEKRGPFADAEARHSMAYSRHHKSRYFCSSCHDVSNPVLANLDQGTTAPGDGVTVLQSEQVPAYSYGHVERTFSEFRLSDYGTGAGADGIGPYAPDVFSTSRPGNQIAACQDCHMPDGVGYGANKNGLPLRPTESVEHPKSGVPMHDLAGGNVLMPWILATTVAGTPNYDATNAALLEQGPAALTLDLSAGEALDPAALLEGVDRALANLTQAASVGALTYDGPTGQIDFRIQNQTGHKLISGYPEGRRMWVNIRAYRSGGVVWELNPYSVTESTLKGLSHSPYSPALGPNEQHADQLVYEVTNSSSFTGESHTFHMVLADARYKDNRIPPRGFRIAEASARQCEPVWGGSPAPDYFDSSEYAGGFDAVQVLGAPDADGIEVSLYYQSTSREFIEFLSAEIEGTGGTLSSPTPSGEAQAYIAGSDSYFDQLRGWGPTIWQLWNNNRDVPGAAPVLMARAVWGSIADPCAEPGSDGAQCDDLDPCTTDDVCAAGLCAGTPVVCAPLDECHDAGECNPATGICDNPIAADGTPCSGGICLGGECAPADGIYQLISAHSGMCVEVASDLLNNGANIQQWTCDGADNQRWRLIRRPDGSYRLRVQHSNKCMRARGQPPTDGNNVQQGRCIYKRSKWLFTHLGGGEYQLQSLKTGLCADVTGGSTADGTNLQQWTCDGSTVQRFTLLPSP